MSDFLNPKATVTPGVAGAVAMLLTNTLSSNFGVPSQGGALVISFLLGLFVFAAPKLPWFKRAGYYVINSLIIFSVATGSNQVGVEAAASEDQTDAATAAPEASVPFFSNWLDDTVSKRNAERAAVSQVDGNVAEQALQRLESGPLDPRVRAIVEQGRKAKRPPKEVLDHALAGSRKAEDVKRIGDAVRPPR